MLPPVFDSLMYLQIEVLTWKFAAGSAVAVHFIASNTAVEQHLATLLWVAVC